MHSVLISSFESMLQSKAYEEIIIQIIMIESALGDLYFSFMRRAKKARQCNFCYDNLVQVYVMSSLGFQQDILFMFETLYYSKEGGGCGVPHFLLCIAISI